MQRSCILLAMTCLFVLFVPGWIAGALALDCGAAWE
jgi:hypothetical protein